jgi:lipopolysaccharide export LptBFGC system permease protein LptF
VADGRDRSAIVFGVFFVVVGVAFLLDRLDLWTIRARYLPPIVLIAFGVAVLLGGRRSSRPRS